MIVVLACRTLGHILSQLNELDLKSKSDELLVVHNFKTTFLAESCAILMPEEYAVAKEL